MLRHLGDEPFGADRVARVEHHRVRDGAHHRQVLERHLRRAVFADRHAGVGAGQLHVQHRDPGHADEIGGAVEEAGERRREWNRAACREPHRRSDHDLLGDEHLEEAIGCDLLEAIAEGGILHVGVERDDARVHLADGGERRAPRLAGGDEIAHLVGGRRQRAVVGGRRGRAGAARPADGRFRIGARQLRLELLDRLVGLLAALQRLAVPGVLSFDRREPLAFQRARHEHGRLTARRACHVQSLSGRPRCRGRRRPSPSSRRRSTGPRCDSGRDRTRSAGSVRARWRRRSRTGCPACSARPRRRLPTPSPRQSRRRRAGRRCDTPSRSAARSMRCRSPHKCPGRASRSRRRRRAAAGSGGLRGPMRTSAAPATARAERDLPRPTRRRGSGRHAPSTGRSDRCRDSAGSSDRSASPRRTAPP